VCYGHNVLFCYDRKIFHFEGEKKMNEYSVLGWITLFIQNIFLVLQIVLNEAFLIGVVIFGFFTIGLMIIAIHEGKKDDK
jgi:hypothetical protein